MLSPDQARFLLSIEGRKAVADSIGHDKPELIEECVMAIFNCGCVYLPTRMGDRRDDLTAISDKVQRLITNLDKLDAIGKSLLVRGLLRDRIGELLEDALNPRQYEETLRFLSRLESALKYAAQEADPRGEDGPKPNTPFKELDRRVAQIFRKNNISISLADGKPRATLMTWVVNVLKGDEAPQTYNGIRSTYLDTTILIDSEI